ncbi:MAG TPA: glycoside hydrolase family 9 protein [Terriglobales bacterium]|nr:glycoside hydrolase family 9 protein [Terriglobales bacterium]
MKSAVALILFTLIPLAGHATGTEQQAPTTAIKVDQVGYRPADTKIVLVVSPQAAKTFSVQRSADHSIALEGKVGPPVLDPDTGDRVQEVDFSSLKIPGRYYINVPEIGRSWDFEIGNDVFARTFDLAMRAFYGQRCGMRVDMGPEFPKYVHPACHLKGEFHASSGQSGTRNNVGGWHDAGDYGRYVVNSGITTGSLLWAFELFGPQLRDRKLDIPESGNGAPDILNEARWNIEWMLQMQDKDGGAWHKQTSEYFPGFISPEDDNLSSKVIGTGSVPYKSTCATADLAAVAAISARVYAPFDKGFAERNLKAAQRAWQWTEQYPNVAFKNPPGVSTGEYGDGQCSDERLWAAAELWRTTGESAYHRYFLDNYRQYLPIIASTEPPSWAQLSQMALLTYAISKRPGQDETALDAIRNAAVTAAEQIVRRTRENPYHVSLTTRDYIWGSNGVAAQYGMQLLATNAIAPKPEFRAAAADNLHYLLGRNTFSLSWITQVGENPFRHPHHRPSVAMGGGEPWPGLLSGGPNANRQDDVLKRLPVDLPPAKVYADDKDSYASNEIAINWQAAVVVLLAGQLQP